MTATPDPWSDEGTRWRAAEAACLFAIAPVAGALFLPPDAMFTMLFAMTALGLWLLHRTEGFRWRDLAHGWDRIDWAFVAALGAVTGIAGFAIIQVTQPSGTFYLVRESPLLMLAVILLYPVLSALPQEVVFRPLFFRRYAAILPRGRTALLLNAGVFSLAHLMYWSWIVAAMTFVGGLAFAHAYTGRGGFPTAVAAHSLAGLVVFMMGLGTHFYSGNVTRPF